MYRYRTTDTSNRVQHLLITACVSGEILERPQSRRTDPLLLIYSFQFGPAFRATTTPSQPQLRRPYKAPTSVVTDNLVKLTVV